MRNIQLFVILLATLMFSGLSMADNKAVIGTVDTSMRLIGANDSIKVVLLTDPDMPAVHCYMSTAVTGDVEGSLGIASDKSEYDLSCFTDGTVTVSELLPQQAQIAMEQRSAFFKKLRIVRILDREHRRIIYLAYTTWLIDGSPKHAMTSIGY